MSEQRTDRSEDESPSDTRERLEHEADAARARLIQRLETIKRRTRGFADAFARLRAEVERRPVLFAAIGVGAAALVGAAVYRRRARARRADVRYQIARAVSVLLGTGNTPQVPAGPPSFAKKSLFRVGDALVSAAMSEIGRRSTAHFTREPGYRPPP